MLHRTLDTSISQERKHTMQSMTKRHLAAPIFAGLLAIGSCAFAAELPDGTVISKSNIDQIKNDTFMGHKIGDLLTPTMEMFVRTYDKKYPLKKLPDMVFDPKYNEATQKYSGQVKYDPATRKMDGYVAGLPFPTIDPADPAAGDKVIYNTYFGNSTGSDYYQEPLEMIGVNKNGFESYQHWNYQRIYAKGRLWGDTNPYPNEPDVLSKTVLVAMYPPDIRGIGTLGVRYTTPRLEDNWAYVKSARRVRRLSGNAWMDNVPGQDLLYDDINIWAALPTAYPSVKLLGKRWILANTHYTEKSVKEKRGTPEQFPHLDTKNEPRFNTYMNVTPREVWIVEGIPPVQHPYGKKVVYLDAKTYSVLQGEMYDKKGALWRFHNYHYIQRIGIKSGIMYAAALSGDLIDVKAHHATFWFAPGRADVGIDPKKISVDMLETLQ